MSILSCLIIPLPLWLPILAILPITWAFITSIRRLAWYRENHAICRIHFLKNKHLTLFQHDDNPIDEGEIIYRFVSSFLCTIVIQGKQRRYSLLVMSDSLPPHQFRHLRLQLNGIDTHT